MKYKLKILYIEDSDAQTFFIGDYLRHQGFTPQIERVTSDKEFSLALTNDHWDVILSNTSPAHFNIKNALAILNKNEMDIPFIVLSDTITTEAAVELMHTGVNYCLSRKKIQELPNILQKEIKDAKIRSDNLQIFQKIERAKQEWEATVDAITEIIILTDLDGDIIRVNETAIRKFETTYLDLIGTNIEDILLDTSQNDVQDIQFFGEIQIPDINGWFDVSSYPIYLNDDLHGLVYLFKDITDRKVYEERLEHFNHLSGFGTLVASIINHEIYGPIFQSKEKIRQFERNQDSEEYSIEEIINLLEDVKAAIDSIEEKMNSIAAYAGDIQSQVVECDLNEIIIEMLNIIHRKIEPEVEILVKTNLQANLPKVYCDDVQIMLALINIVQNAIEALPEGGEILISSSENSLRTGQTIAIKDNGKGIPKFMIKNIMDSFLTTKSREKSVGLGLTLAKKIIDLHDGKFDVYSLPDEGTQIEIFLPY